MLEIPEAMQIEGSFICVHIDFPKPHSPVGQGDFTGPLTGPNLQTKDLVVEEVVEQGWLWRRTHLWPWLKRCARNELIN